MIERDKMVSFLKSRKIFYSLLANHLSTFMRRSQRKKNVKGIFGLFLILLCLALPGIGHGQQAAMKIVPTMEVPPAGKISVAYKITNTGAATAYHMTVTAFLASDARRSDNLGDSPPGGVVRYACDFDTAELKPGTYTLVTRINYGGARSGPEYRIYHFSPVVFRSAQAGDKRPALSVTLAPPVFNIKRLFNREGQFRLTLTNGHREAIRPVVSFFLPDGVEMAKTDTGYALKPGETISDNLTARREDSVRESRPYRAEVRYDVQGVHYSRLLEGSIGIEEKPLYFKAYLAAGGIIVVSVILILFFRKRRREG
jgi:hypothetical protein